MKTYIIYVMTNVNNGKMYIGQTYTSIKDRMKGHRSKSERCTKLRYAIQKHGIERFLIEEIDRVYSKREADYFEDFYILAGDTINHGYNIRRGGSNGEIHESSKKKISASLTGKVQSEETKVKRKQTWNAKKLLPPSEEQLDGWQRAALANKGKKRSQESIDLIAKTKLERGSTKRGSQCSGAVLNETQVKKIKRLIMKGKLSYVEIGALYGVNKHTIGKIAIGKNWNHVEVNGFIPQKRIEKITNEEIEDIRTMYRKGKPIVAIAKKLHHARYTVSKIIHTMESDEVRPRWKKGEENGSAKLSTKKVSKIRKLRADGKTITYIAKKTGISRSQIFRIIKNQSWKI